MFNFERLETWPMAIHFADLVCDLHSPPPFGVEGGVTFEGGELSTIN